MYVEQQTVTNTDRRHWNRGGGESGAHAPPSQPAEKGGSAPTARAMPINAVIDLTMRYHSI